MRQILLNIFDSTYPALVELVYQNIWVISWFLQMMLHQKRRFMTLHKPCAFPVSYIPIHGECAFPVTHIAISGEDESQWNKHTYREWRCESPGMGICLTRSAHSHQEWGCDSPGMGCALPGMGIWLAGNAHPHRECTLSPGIHILTGNAYHHRECT